MAHQSERFGKTPSPLLPVGDAAANFTLRHTFEESVDLGELLTHSAVVLVFYVFDFGDY